MTQREVVAKVMELDGVTAEEKEVLQGLLDTLRKRAEKASARVAENDGVRDKILDALAEIQPATSKEVGERVGISTGKAAGLLKTLVDAEKVEKVPKAKAKDTQTYKVR